MHDKKLIQLLRTFETSEIKALDKFVRSPYFNTNPTIVKLWTHIKKYAPDFSAAPLSEEKTFKKVFPKTAFNEQKLRKLRSILLKIVQDFLATEQFRKDDFLCQKKLATAYYEKELYSWFEDSYRKKIKQLNEKPILNEIDYYQLNQLHHELFFNQRSKKHIPTPPDLVACSIHLAYYNELKKLKYLCEWKNRAFLTKEVIPEKIQVLKIDNNYLRYSNPLFQMYHGIFRMFTEVFEKAQQTFLNVIQLYETHSPKLPKDDKVLIIHYLLNFGVSAIRFNEKKYGHTLLSLYKKALDSQALLWKNQLESTSYTNIVYLGSRIGEFNWTNQFIYDYQHKLSGGNPALYFEFALSILGFHQKEYEITFYRLENFNFPNLTMELSRKTLQIRSGFECFLKRKDFYQILIYKSENFKKYLQRKNELSNTKKDDFLKFNDTVRKITCYLYEYANADNFEKLETKVRNEERFLGRTWLLNHLNLILKNKGNYSDLVTPNT